MNSEKEEGCSKMAVAMARVKPLTGEKAQKFLAAFNSSKLNKEVAAEVNKNLEQKKLQIKK